MMLDENENQSETEIADNLDDFIDNVAEHLLNYCINVTNFY